MPANQNDYDFIKDKIHVMKETYPSLREKADEYVLSALVVKASYYKNPALVLNESDFANFIVDGQYDGGVDILLSDPNSESSNMIIGQSKFYQNITFDDAVNAITKMVLFYKDMIQGHYEQVNDKVQGRFLSLYSEIGEESKIAFVLYTSAPKGGIRKDRLEKKFREQFSDSSQFELSVLFGSDVVSEIKESECRRPTVELGKIKLDKRDNYLEYGESAAIVNVSAFSIKSLYAQHNTNLLSRNLRYHVSGREIDKGINETIRDNPDSFWLKNNGVTIICDEFKIDGKEVKLKNFSIVNGGQTTYMLHKSKLITESQDFYLPCKIIKTDGTNEDEKNLFSLEIAKATNSQKAIRPVDLKANSPEQVRFSQTMREAGVFYQTKRGEVVPREFKPAYLNSDLSEVGKLCLSGIFQMPGTSRNKPSSLYNPNYYNVIFDGNQTQIAKICKELLYVDYYFRNAFLKRFDSENRNQPDGTGRITFAHNARTICLAFVVLASRYYQENIQGETLQFIFDSSRSEKPDPHVYESMKNLTGIKWLLPPNIFENKDNYEEILYKLFMHIINAGSMCYEMAVRYEEGLNATNYLKKDKNYYGILQFQWQSLKVAIKETFDAIV
ncbi:hypothetical protein C818_00772 [Lachnospiraceae bacterium MD308]|nr:hypothetical protein C818_00772 [Lachnospiraceae bacterium MD308]